MQATIYHQGAEIAVHSSRAGGRSPDRSGGGDSLAGRTPESCRTLIQVKVMAGSGYAHGRDGWPSVYRLRHLDRLD